MESNRDIFPGLQAPTYQCGVIQVPWLPPCVHRIRLSSSGSQPTEVQEEVGLGVKDHRKGGADAQTLGNLFNA